MKMETVVIGCFKCAGEENPEKTCTIFYRAENGKTKMHWLCHPCTHWLQTEKGLQNLTSTDMHPQAQREFDGFSPSRERERSPINQEGPLH